MTPQLPEWVRSHRLAGYRSIYELVPDETRLYGTESLYGDWNGRLLLLAKDFACSKVVHDRIARHDPRPYRHEPTLRTNTHLRRWADGLATSSEPTRCGILYGSAAACLLRDDGQMSGTLPERKAVLDFAAQVLQWVHEQMASLRIIMCLGEEAWRCATAALGIVADWKTCRDSGEALEANGIWVVASYHPAARVSGDAHASPWEVVRSLLETRKRGHREFE